MSECCHGEFQQHNHHTTCREAQVSKIDYVTCGGSSIVLDRIVEANRHPVANDDAAAGIPAGKINIFLFPLLTL